MTLTSYRVCSKVFTAINGLCYCGLQVFICVASATSAAEIVLEFDFVATVAS